MCGHLTSCMFCLLSYSPLIVPHSSTHPIGFYKFDKNRKASPDPAIAPLIKQSMEAAVAKGLRAPDKMSLSDR